MYTNRICVEESPAEQYVYKIWPPDVVNERECTTFTLASFGKRLEVLAADGTGQIISSEVASQERMLSEAAGLLYHGDSSIVRTVGEIIACTTTPSHQTLLYAVSNPTPSYLLFHTVNSNAGRLTIQDRN